MGEGREEKKRHVGISNDLYIFSTATKVHRMSCATSWTIMQFGSLMNLLRKAISTPLSKPDERAMEKAVFLGIKCGRAFFMIQTCYCLPGKKLCNPSPVCCNVREFKHFVQPVMPIIDLQVPPHLSHLLIFLIQTVQETILLQKLRINEVTVLLKSYQICITQGEIKLLRAHIKAF